MSQEWQLKCQWDSGVVVSCAEKERLGVAMHSKDESRKCTLEIGTVVYLGG